MSAQSEGGPSPHLGLSTSGESATERHVERFRQLSVALKEAADELGALYGPIYFAASADGTPSAADAARWLRAESNAREDYDEVGEAYDLAAQLIEMKLRIHHPPTEGTAL